MNNDQLMLRCINTRREQNPKYTHIVLVVITVGTFLNQK